MQLNRMPDYATYHAAFRWEVPATFNFAVDVVDAWAPQQGLEALVAVDAAGGSRRFTFADISTWSKRVARLLAEAGVAKGDRLLVMLPRIPEWHVAMTACLRLGVVPIPCITMLTHADIRYRAEHARVVGAITTASEVHKFAGIDGLAVRLSVGDAPGWTPFSAADSMADDVEPATIGAEDPAILYYTSGSTGGPKGVTLPARSLFVWRGAAEHWLSLDPGDLMWCTADTGWAKAGTSILFGPWARGASVLFYDGPFEPVRRFELIAEFGVTCFCASATELRRLVEVDTSPFDLSRLQLTVSAGESVNPEIVERWGALAGTPLLDGYGQTETLVTITNMAGMPVKAGSMGRPLPGVHAAALLDDGSVAERSAAGQMLIRTPNPQLMLGYRDDEPRTRAAYVEIDGTSWFLTGDNVEIDDDGYIFYTGRVDDVISSSGYRIGPQEVENVLIEHPAVRESAVVGTPDPERGELVTAYIVLAPGFEGSDELAGDIQAFVRAATAPYKYPRRIHFVDDLPKTVTGKIRRNVLRNGHQESA